jgi:TPR repeat protein
LRATDEVRLDGDEPWRPAREILGFVPHASDLVQQPQAVKDHTGQPVSRRSSHLYFGAVALVASAVTGTAVWAIMFLSRSAAPPAAAPSVQHGEPKAMESTEPGRVKARGGVPEEVPQSAEWYRKAAEQGDADAQFNLGNMYTQGDGVPKDLAEAVKWYQKAAEQGSAKAQFNLGLRHAFGEGVPKDSAEAVKWYRKAAEQGDAKAQFNLGCMYGNGDGVPKDLAETVKWYRRAAEQGFASAQFSLGYMYDSGDGVPKDSAEAVKWYQKAAEQGFAIAQLNLGNMYCKGVGVPKDFAEAAKWYQKAAEQGFAKAQFNLGLMYGKGDGVPKDLAEAVKWYQKAAEQGFARAQFSLGNMYGKGDGVPKDLAEAVKWYRRAAEQGDAIAQFNLGLMYDNGDGVPKDSAEAVKWYRRAAEQGDAAAQCNLATKYSMGEGVPKNFVSGYVWASLSAAQGEELGRKKRDAIETFMTREQIAEAQALAAAFKPRVEKPSDNVARATPIGDAQIDAFGSGFFITGEGCFVTNHHVIADARRLRVRAAGGIYPATVLRDDPSNDLAILKVEGKFASLPVGGSRGLKLADRVATIGFPIPELQGLAAKYSDGVIAALSGPGDDPRFLQISVPVQPGNSGGPLLDSSGRVVGVIVSQLDKITTLKVAGVLPENVNYAIKGTILLGLLESVPGLADKVATEPAKPPKDAAEVAKLAEEACGMVMVEK